jgi:hypothetical protein
MTTGRGPGHVVVDGSNIATEGRSVPSLTQLNEAVMSFIEEFPGTAITVVVDATFGHRIDKKEAKDFDDAIANNELVAPPAGAVGRGDAFVLGIAQKANASVLSNDSFQEFHGQYEWLFDEGRLIGGKPVPHVGWVFVERSPVRGAVSRQATGSRRGSRTKKDGRVARPTSDAASQPMPVPKSPPPGRSRTPIEEVAAVAVEASAGSARGSGRTAARAERENGEAAGRRGAPKVGEIVNDLMPFLEFVEHHPIGTSVNGTVESYSSHGAYVAIGESGVRGYVPLRLMGEPAPTSARKVMKTGESVTLVVVSFAPQRRSIDCALPDMAQMAMAEQEQTLSGDSTTDAPVAPVRKTAARKSAASKASAPKTAAKRPSTKNAAAEEETTPEVERAPKPAAKRAAAKRAPAATAPAKKAPAKKAAAKQTAARNPAAQKPAAQKAASPKPAAAEKSAPTRSTAAKSTAKKSAATKTAATRSTAAKSNAAKAAAKKAPTKQPAAKKAPARKSAAKKAARTPSPGRS